MNKIPVILLAAGQSRRMGGLDKLMQEVDGIPLLRRAAKTAQTVGPVIVALPPEPHPRHDALSGLDVLRVAIDDAAEGMNASLRGALKHVHPDAQAAMVLLADLPDLTEADLTAVLRARATHPNHLIWRGATETGKPGHPVLFDRKLFLPLSKLTGDQGAQTVVRAYKDKVHVHALPGQRAVLDLDTPEDWAIWRMHRSP
ncbi:nucleotidyltransferase family protein [Rhodobacteraceae bacterium B1Z28]|uniref:Nucleotidyltransferase family protein n=1 Tax=Ruegeria haliotis TaxID=2747601 RepID=A0ABX2PMI8_9RHOB|nr:nucleotidyltransferase family protein [Ruegeria haliotis]NVO54980.1 nucleotidyltransferase family protein [Ruegeria haliotis]